MVRPSRTPSSPEQTQILHHRSPPHQHWDVQGCPVETEGSIDTLNLCSVDHFVCGFLYIYGCGVAHSTFFKNSDKEHTKMVPYILYCGWEMSYLCVQWQFYDSVSVTVKEAAVSVQRCKDKKPFLAWDSPALTAPVWIFHRPHAHTCMKRALATFPLQHHSPLTSTAYCTWCVKHHTVEYSV